VDRSLSRKETEIRFALDSLVEGGGFEPSVPRTIGRLWTVVVLICTGDYATFNSNHTSDGTRHFGRTGSQETVEGRKLKTVTSLARNREFESISLQQTVCLSSAAKADSVTYFGTISITTLKSGLDSPYEPPKIHMTRVDTTTDAAAEHVLDELRRRKIGPSGLRGERQLWASDGAAGPDST
jgi:hypothetical protein